jgi:hypothetical protein
MPPFLNLSGIISLREWVYLNWYRAHAVEADGTPMDVRAFDPNVWGEPGAGATVARGA